MATEQEIMQCLAMLSAAYPEWQKDQPQEPLRQTYRVYVQLLGDLPTDALREATLHHIRESKFFPKVSELRERASKLQHDHRTPRARAVLIPPRPSSEEMEKVRKLIAGLTEKFDATKSTLH